MKAYKSIPTLTVHIYFKNMKLHNAKTKSNPMM